MSRRRIAAGLLGLSAAALSLVGHTPPGGGPPALPDRTVVHAFPSKEFDPSKLDPAALYDAKSYAAASDTAWVIRWELVNPAPAAPPSSVFRINSADFMCRDKAGASRWVRVVTDLSMAEVFVPYDDASYWFEDVANQAFAAQPASAALFGPPCLAAPAVLAAQDPLQAGRVVKEVHDDGVRWLDNTAQGAPDRCRRGEKLLLWVNFYAQNYRYVIEFGFSDDGTISCRLGGTARNFYPRKPDGSDAHLHVGCWVFDADLGDPTDPANGGPASNQIRLVRRLPVNPGAADGLFRTDVGPFPGGPAANPSRAGSAQWLPEQFTTLRVESLTRKNGNTAPRPLGYDLVPVRAGSCRDFPPGFDYAQKDFWVTPAEPGFTTIKQLPSYVAGSPGPLTGKKLRVWHNSPILHVPRAEDFGPDGVSNGSTPQYGVALTAWAGFTLKPRDLFDSTPLFKP